MMDKVNEVKDVYLENLDKLMLKDEKLQVLIEKSE